MCNEECIAIYVTCVFSLAFIHLYLYDYMLKEYFQNIIILFCYIIHTRTIERIRLLFDENSQSGFLLLENFHDEPYIHINGVLWVIIIYYNILLNVPESSWNYSETYRNVQD